MDRARLALLLHKTPAEVDAMPLQDQWDVLQVYAAMEEAKAQQMKPKRRKSPHP